ncbi:hypothetical protein [Spirosoma pollinicola]|uniref:Uncharacterized protein n=1 Tax=Spirosoma pollinicola TaxID=2057025 RepID=A0A2K8YUQ5_9BACT|nr:hypothetical protein [Spirosoma pollinicola]AUD01362.1 hypothetical protein CWM47_05780 [Spirosoma pollinicola]
MKGQIDFRIDSIRDIEFFLHASDTINLAQLGIQVEGKDMVAYGDSKTVTLTTEVKYVQNYETENAELVLRYLNEMTFYIDNFDENFRLENGKYIFDRDLARFLLDIITPTIRGILFTKTAGTGLAKCYLPVIPADQIIDGASETI